MATLPIRPDAFTQPEADITSSGVNVAPFAWTTNDITSVKDIITYVQTAVQAAESAQANAEVASAAANRIAELDGQYQSKLIDIDNMYSDMVVLSNNVNLTEAILLNYQSTTKGYMDETQVLHDSVSQLRDDVITYAMQAVYRFGNSGDTGGDGTITLEVADGTIQYFKLIVPQTTFAIGSFTDPSSTCRQLTLMIEQGTGANKINWPSNIKWNNGRDPVLSYISGKIDFLTLLTKDSGNSWYGFYNGGWFDA